MVSIAGDGRASAVQQLDTGLLLRAYSAGLLNHGNDPVLNWCASNLVARRDVNMNTAPDKRRAADKIDDFVALLMGIGSSLVAPPAKQFQSFFV